MPDIDIQITDNSGEILREMEHKQQAILEAWGITGEGYGKKNCQVDTGRARNSITHAVRGNVVYIGSNLSYFPWLELGTGIYASDGKGRKSPWGYYDRNGKYHITRGMKPSHTIKKAASEHNEEYKRIAENIGKQ